ncbi:Crp/Fnr family transcriptional regulator [Salinisphaera hydrothermalis]|uniref:Crp/Fnr family transcriptional regulator n=1 Tax=Salinisphaera hydrothermalis TaxID=563188 RepID=UPI0033402902
MSIAPRVNRTNYSCAPKTRSADRSHTTGRGNCRVCIFKSRCLPAELEGESLRAFEQQIWRQARPVKAGQMLVHQGDMIDSIYALRVGSLKAFIDESDGNERVMAFRFPGTIIGLAEPYQKQWVRSFATLEDSWLCRIPVSAITEALHRQLIHLMSVCLRREYEAHLTLALSSGTRKVVSFLLELSAIFKSLGQSPTHLRLPMTYLDVASYLGMRHESLSRTLAQLQKQTLLRKKGKEIHIDDLPGLLRLKTEDVIGAAPMAVVPAGTPDSYRGSIDTDPSLATHRRSK